MILASFAHPKDANRFEHLFHCEFHHCEHRLWTVIGAGTCCAGYARRYCAPPTYPIPACPVTVPRSHFGDSYSVCLLPPVADCIQTSL